MRCLFLAFITTQLFSSVVFALPNGYNFGNSPWPVNLETYPHVNNFDNNLNRNGLNKACHKLERRKGDKLKQLDEATFCGDFQTFRNFYDLVGDPNKIFHYSFKVPPRHFEAEGRLITNRANLLSSALFGAVNNFSEGHKEILNFLIDEGANLDQRNIEYVTRHGRFEETPAGLVIKRYNQKILSFLISKGMDVNYDDDRTDSPLISAIYNINHFAIELLMKNGADVNQLTTKTCFKDSIDRMRPQLIGKLSPCTPFDIAHRIDSIITELDNGYSKYSYKKVMQIIEGKETRLP